MIVFVVHYLFFKNRINKRSFFVDLPTPFFPIPLYTSNDTDFGLIFDDFLQFDDLYQKPVFGDCVWSYPSFTDTKRHPTATIHQRKNVYEDDDEVIYGAWLPVELMNDYSELISQSGRHNICRVVPQPARFNGKPIAFVVSVQHTITTWITPIQWQRHCERHHSFNCDSLQFEEVEFYDKKRKKNIHHSQAISFPEEFESQYKYFLLSLDGEQEAVFPLSGRRMNFTRKNSADPSNQLHEMIEYFEEIYTSLSIKSLILFCS
jgi:hypothetical protein